MNPVSIQLPEGSEVYNFLYPSKDPDYLVQDLFAVRLPNGCCVDVGWYPEHDPNGDYVISVFYEYGDHPLGAPCRTKDLAEVIRTVQSLAHRYERGSIATTFSASCSNEPPRMPAIY
jgi:hypothetical protein